MQVGSESLRIGLELREVDIEYAVDSDGLAIPNECIEYDGDSSYLFLLVGIGFILGVGSVHGCGVEDDMRILGEVESIFAADSIGDEHLIAPLVPVSRRELQFGFVKDIGFSSEEDGVEVGLVLEEVKSFELSVSEGV